MKTYNIEVRQTVRVTLDETKFTPEFMEEFRASFYQFHDIEDHAEHVAQLAARGIHDFGHDRTEFVEGYGPVGDFGMWVEAKDTTTEMVD